MDEAIAAGLYGSVNGNSGWKYNIEDYSSLFLTSFAGPETIYQALTNQISFADERIVNAVETCADWYTKGYLCSDYLSLSWDDAAMLLSEGRAPFFFGPIKFMQFMMNYAVGDQADDFRFAPFPAADGSNYYAMGTTCVMAINANSQHKDVCAELLNTMVSLEFVSQMAEVWPGYWGIPLKDIGSLDTSSLTGLSKYYAEALIKACEEIGKGNFGYYCSSYMPTETYELITSIDSVWLQTMTAQQLMEKVDTTFEKEYSANMVPPVPKPGRKFHKTMRNGDRRGRTLPASAPVSPIYKDICHAKHFKRKDSKDPAVLPTADAGVAAQLRRDICSRCDHSDYFFYGFQRNCAECELGGVGELSGVVIRLHFRQGFRQQYYVDADFCNRSSGSGGDGICLAY